MHAAYEELPEGMKQKLEGRTATHDFEKFWEVMRLRPGSRRPALTEEQKRRKPPVSQPLIRVHPLTGRKVLYANPGYTMWIDGMDGSRATRSWIICSAIRSARISSMRITGRWATC